MRSEYLYSFDYLIKDRLLAKINVYSDHVEIHNFADDHMDLPFGGRQSVKYKELENFYEYRCFPDSRLNAKQLLSGKTYDYDRLKVIKETHGIMSDDFYWIRFEDEELCWSDVEKWHTHV